MATTLPTSAEGTVDRLTPNVPMLILLAHLFDGDGEGICAEPCGNREAQWPSLWPRRQRGLWPGCKPSGRERSHSLRPLLAVPAAAERLGGAAWLHG